MNSDRPISRLISALVLLSAITGAMLLLFMLLSLYTKAAIGQEKPRGNNGQPGVARIARLETRTEVVRVVEMNAQGLIYLPLDTEVKKKFTLQKRKREVWIRQAESPRELPWAGRVVGANFPQTGTLLLITICEKCGKDGQRALFAFLPIDPTFSPYEIRLRTGKN